MSGTSSTRKSAMGNRPGPRSVPGRGPKRLSRNQRRLRSRVRRLQASGRAPEPVVEEPVVEEPVVEEPVVEEPVVEEPVVEEPVVEEPVVALRPVPGRARTAAVSPSPRARRQPSVARVGVAFVVLLLMTAVAALGVRLLQQQSSDSGSLSSSRRWSPPVALPAGTAYTKSTVLPSGRLRVKHWIHTRGFVYDVRLHIPKVSGLAPGTLSVHRIVAIADGLQVYAPRSMSGGAATLYTRGAERIFLRYVLDGAVEHTEPPAGRALARVVALDVRDGHSTTKSQTAVAGARVLSLACTAPGRYALPLPCGTPDGSEWSVALTTPNLREQVMAQLDLS